MQGVVNLVSSLSSQRGEAVQQSTEEHGLWCQIAWFAFWLFHQATLSYLLSQAVVKINPWKHLAHCLALQTITAVIIIIITRGIINKKYGLNYKDGDQRDTISEKETLEQRDTSSRINTSMYIYLQM